MSILRFLVGSANSFAISFFVIAVFIYYLNNLLVLGQQNWFVLVEVDIDDTIGVVVKDVFGGRLTFAISVGGTIAIVLGIGGLGGGGRGSVKAVVEAFQNALLDVGGVFALAVTSAENQSDRDDHKECQNRKGDNDNVGTEYLCLIEERIIRRRRRRRRRVHLVVVERLVIVIDLFAVVSHPAAETRAGVKVTVAVLLGSDALAAVQTLHRVASGTFLDANLAFPALVIVLAFAKGSVFFRVVCVRNVIRRREPARRSVLAVQSVAPVLAVISAPSERTEALGGLGLHARLLGALGVVVADAQAAVKTVFVLVTGAVVVLNGAGQTVFAVVAGSAIGTVALVFLREFVKDNAISTIKALQLFADSGNGTGRKGNLAFHSLVVSGAFAIKGHAATSVVVGNVVVMPAAGAMLAVQVADVAGLTLVAGGSSGTRAVVARRHVGLVGR